MSPFVLLVLMGFINSAQASCWLFLTDFGGPPRKSKPTPTPILPAPPHLPALIPPRSQPSLPSEMDLENLREIERVSGYAETYGLDRSTLGSLKVPLSEIMSRPAVKISKQERQALHALGVTILDTDMGRTVQFSKSALSLVVDLFVKNSFRSEVHSIFHSKHYRLFFQPGVFLDLTLLPDGQIRAESLLYGHRGMPGRVHTPLKPPPFDTFSEEKIAENLELLVEIRKTAVPVLEQLLHLEENKIEGLSELIITDWPEDYAFELLITLGYIFDPLAWKVGFWVLETGRRQDEVSAMTQRRGQMILEGLRWLVNSRSVLIERGAFNSGIPWIKRKGVYSRRAYNSFFPKGCSFSYDDVTSNDRFWEFDALLEHLKKQNMIFDGRWRTAPPKFEKH